MSVKFVFLSPMKNSPQAVERIGRSALKDDNNPGDLLVLSCEEDYADCVPFLEKG